MKLAYPEIETVFHFGNACCHSLIIENPDLFYRFVDDLVRQCRGEDGVAVLSMDDKTLPIAGNLDLITDFFSFEINRKVLLNRIFAKLEKQALAPDFYERTQQLVCQTERLIRDLAFQNDLDLELPHLSILSLLKATGLCLKEDYPSLAEKILDYMELVSGNGFAKLFVLVNLRSLVNDRIMELFVDQCCRNGYNILLVDNKSCTKLPHEQRTIIDTDLCEI